MVAEVMVAEVTGEAAAPCMLAAVECTWVEAECMSVGVPRCALAAADAVFGTAVGTPTESARAGVSPRGATSGFAVKDCRVTGITTGPGWSASRRALPLRHACG
jgi:hypothetical protein